MDEKRDKFPPKIQLLKKEWLNTKEVAHILNCTVRNVNYMIMNGDMVAVKAGDGKLTWMVHHGDVNRIFNQKNNQRAKRNRLARQAAAEANEGGE